MAKGFKETAAELLKQEAAQSTPQEKKDISTTTEAKKRKSAGDPAAMFDKLTPEQQADLVKYIKGASQYSNTGTEKRTQRLTLVLRPSLVKRAREAAAELHYRSFTEFLEEAITEKLERI